MNKKFLFLCSAMVLFFDLAQAMDDLNINPSENSTQSVQKETPAKRKRKKRSKKKQIQNVTPEIQKQDVELYFVTHDGVPWSLNEPYLEKLSTYLRGQNAEKQYQAFNQIGRLYNRQSTLFIPRDGESHNKSDILSDLAYFLFKNCIEDPAISIYTETLCFYFEDKRATNIALSDGQMVIYQCFPFVSRLCGKNANKHQWFRILTSIVFQMENIISIHNDFFSRILERIAPDVLDNIEDRRKLSVFRQYYLFAKGDSLRIDPFQVFLRDIPKLSDKQKQIIIQLGSRESLQDWAKNKKKIELNMDELGHLLFLNKLLPWVIEFIKNVDENSPGYSHYLHDEKSEAFSQIDLEEYIVDSAANDDTPMPFSKEEINQIWEDRTRQLQIKFSNRATNFVSISPNFGTSWQEQWNEFCTFLGADPDTLSHTYFLLRAEHTLFHLNQALQNISIDQALQNCEETFNLFEMLGIRQNRKKEQKGVFTQHSKNILQSLDDNIKPKKSYEENFRQLRKNMSIGSEKLDKLLSQSADAQDALNDGNVDKTTKILKGLQKNQENAQKKKKVEERKKAEERKKTEEKKKAEEKKKNAHEKSQSTSAFVSMRGNTYDPSSLVFSHINSSDLKKSRRGSKKPTKPPVKTVKQIGEYKVSSYTKLDTSPAYQALRKEAKNKTHSYQQSNDVSQPIQPYVIKQDPNIVKNERRRTTKAQTSTTKKSLISAEPAEINVVESTRTNEMQEHGLENLPILYGATKDIKISRRKTSYQHSRHKENKENTDQDDLNIEIVSTQSRRRQIPNLILKREISLDTVNTGATETIENITEDTSNIEEKPKRGNGTKSRKKSYRNNSRRQSLVSRPTQAMNNAESTNVRDRALTESIEHTPDLVHESQPVSLHRSDAQTREEIRTRIIYDQCLTDLWIMMIPRNQQCIEQVVLGGNVGHPAVLGYNNQLGYLTALNNKILEEPQIEVMQQFINYYNHFVGFCIHNKFPVVVGGKYYFEHSELLAIEQ